VRGAFHWWGPLGRASRYIAAMSDDKLVMIEQALWWNFERWCRIHGYVQTPITGTEITYVHKPGAQLPASRTAAGPRPAPGSSAPGPRPGSGCAPTG